MALDSEGRFRSDVRKKFFHVRVVGCWPRSPREAAAAPSLAGFKARLDGAGSTLGWWNGRSFKIPSDPDHCMVL